jgi:hypothetical protein
MKALWDSLGTKLIDLDAGFVISVANYVSESAYEEAVAEFEAAQFPVLIERREPEVFAAFQYLIPTAIVVFLLKPFAEKFLSRLAEDSYDSCKSAIKKLWRNFLSNDRTFRPRLVATRGKVLDGDLGIELSFVAKTADGQFFRLLFLRGISASEFQRAVLEFYSLMEQHDHAPEASGLNVLAATERKWIHPRVLTWALDRGRLVEVDIVQSARQKKLLTIEISPHD